MGATGDIEIKIHNGIKNHEKSGLLMAPHEEAGRFAIEGSFKIERPYREVAVPAGIWSRPIPPISYADAVQNLGTHVQHPKLDIIRHVPGRTSIYDLGIPGSVTLYARDDFTARDLAPADVSARVIFLFRENRGSMADPVPVKQAVPPMHVQFTGVSRRLPFPAMRVYGVTLMKAGEDWRVLSVVYTYDGILSALS